VKCTKATARVLVPTAYNRNTSEPVLASREII